MKYAAWNYTLYILEQFLIAKYVWKLDYLASGSLPYYCVQINISLSQTCTHKTFTPVPGKRIIQS